MSFKKKMTADLLFGVQIICTFIFGGSQFLRMLTTSQGVTFSGQVRGKCSFSSTLCLPFALIGINRAE